jgi:hypothetical protein
MRLLLGKPERKRSLRRPRHRWKDNIRILKEIEQGVIDRINLAEDRDRWRALVNKVMNLRFPKKYW